MDNEDQFMDVEIQVAIHLILFVLCAWLVLKVLRAYDKVSDYSLRERRRQEEGCDFPSYKMRNPRPSDYLNDAALCYHYNFLHDKKADSETIVDALNNSLVLSKKEKFQNDPKTRFVVEKAIQLLVLSGATVEKGSLDMLRLLKGKFPEVPMDPWSVLDLAVHHHVEQCVHYLESTYRFRYDIQRETRLIRTAVMAFASSHAASQPNAVAALTLLFDSPVIWDKGVSDRDVFCLLWLWAEEPRHYSLLVPIKERLVKALGSCKGTQAEWNVGCKCRVIELLQSVSGMSSVQENTIISRTFPSSWFEHGDV